MQNNRIIIAFTGKKQSGKSTACKYIESLYPGIVQRINMKDALVAELKKNFPRLLREIASTVYPTSALTNFDEEVDRLFVEKPALMRALMQEYGTEVRRGDKESYWTDQWEKAVRASTGRIILVDDVRFLNEAAVVSEHGGRIIRIVKQGQSDRFADQSTHASETEMDSIVVDRTIETADGDILALHKELYTYLGILPRI